MNFKNSNIEEKFVLNNDGRRYINVELSLTAEYNNIISDVQKEIIIEEISELTPIMENDINLSTIYVFDNGSEIEAKIYIRNGFSKNLELEYIPLVIINDKGEILAERTFDFRECETIPPYSARPLKIYFKKAEVNMNGFLPQNCKIAFDKNINTADYCNIELEHLPESMDEFRPAFEKFLHSLSKLERGKVDISTFNISLEESGKIIITLIIRNSMEGTVRIKELPVRLSDENNNIIMSGKFNLNNTEINSMKAKVYNIAFETNLTVEGKINLNQWRVSFK